MNSISKYVAKHSQKIALAFALGTFGTAYLIQPYYEVLTRWSIVKFTYIAEDEPSSRVSRVFKDVCSQFNLTDRQKSQLDLFATPLDESIALGSLNSNSYAFVGIPAIFGYENTSQIPIDSLDFYTPHFPYGPFSKLGKQRLDLMILPDSALRFVLAREIVRLQGQTKNGHQLGSSARTHSMITMGSMIGALYLSYQVAFIMNRSVCLHWPPTRRLLLSGGLCLVGLFCQYQLLLAWRRHRCTEIDRIVASLGESYRQGGLDYYRWRLKYNEFWAERLKEFKKALVDTKNSEKKTEFDPVACYQDEVKQGLTKSSSDYYLPEMLSNQTENQPNSSTRNPKSPKIPNRIDRYRLSRFNETGHELWAADGDGLGFGWTQLLIGDILPRFVSWFFSLFSNPATSRFRIQNLDTIPIRTDD